MRFSIALLATLLASSLALAQPATTRPTQPTLRHVGGDISMLPELERFGARYADRDGKPVDAIAALRDVGWNTFRVRVFVDPTTDFDRSWGATQSLDVARKLAKRIQDAGGEVMLCLHYSDTWADPEHQTKPKAWADLDADGLERRVHDYTADVMKALHEDGVTPTIVQVGNEITTGMLWPDARLHEGTPEERATRSANLVRFVAAGVKAVREASTPAHPIRIALHAHGGGKLDLASFYDRFRDVDYDLIAVSFYPAFGESIPHLSKQIPALRDRFGKDVLVAETSYPHRAMDLDAKWRKFLTWPLTPEGQATFARELHDAVVKAGGVGIVWWYPEAIPVKGHAVWRNGAEGVFDQATGQPLPAAAELSR